MESTNKNIMPTCANDLSSEGRKTRDNLIEYRLDKLEEAVTKLSSLSDIVLRWDARLQQSGGIFQCSVHAARMDEIEKRMLELSKITSERTRSVLLVEEHESKIVEVQNDIKEIKKFMYKAAGAFIVISIIVQLIGPSIVEKLTGISTRPAQKIEVVISPSVGTITNAAVHTIP